MKKITRIFVWFMIKPRFIFPLTGKKYASCLFQ
ncbi:MAG: hypothetical protein GY874_21410 [Desulfobacteraceae bacterium]|nr:hypothetical protein [Desulfobacteraceae bacterium]